ncbi:FdrA family protein [Propionibacteriaceae bacterium G1746]|uniref:FdrA family protein n=1 Tax=Aestuariimicrobium sp. G57 TaxID=3418485 RepID=UPI003C17A1FB
MTVHVELRRGAYYDSVSLMQISQQVKVAGGVDDAQIGMATDLNVALLEQSGYVIPEGATPNDVVVALRAASDDAIASGLQALDAALAALRAQARNAGTGADNVPSRTTGSAADHLPGAAYTVISVPGAHAFTEAMDAVDHGLSVMLFSDNVSVEHEVVLKDAAARKGVLVMGPDCGTAVVNGTALGFANVVRRGPIGMVAASGTGAQQVMCLFDLAGVGISHCLGLGGRDLSATVNGRSASQALAALAADGSTDQIVVVSKPADPAVLARLEAEAAGSGKQLTWATLGRGLPDLTTQAEDALRAGGHDVPTWPHWTGADPAHPVPGKLRGLFCGGTLADEAMFIAEEALGPIQSNLTDDPALAMSASATTDQHAVLDFGDDEMTRGRPHPMIDPSLRLDRLRAEGRDATCGVLLLDLLLGHGAHADPATDHAAAIREARAAAAADGRELPVVVSLIATESDPQGMARTAEALAAAGASVFTSNAQATRHAISLLTEGNHA